MASLYDMLANAQGGQGMEMLARQFGLSQQQTQAAVEALLPAFSQGLKRNASDPYGIGAFVNAMATGQHAKYFDDAQNAFSPQGMAEGNGILGHLFGSKDLSRAVASQAAQATGVGQQVLQQMLPVIASMIMGGLFKQSTGQFGQGQFNPGQFGQGQAAAGFGGSGNPLGEIIEQMMRQGGDMMRGGGQAQPQPRPAPQQPQGQPVDPFDNPFGKVLKDMFGGGAQAEAPQQRRAEPEPQTRNPQQNPFGDNPLGKIFEEMLNGAQGGASGGQGAPTGRRPAPEPEAPEPRVGQSRRQKNPYDDLFGEMFETGAKQRDDYQKGVESIFDQFKQGMDRYR